MLAKAVSYLFSERLIRLIAGIILLGLIAKYFGPDEFGKFTYIYSITGFFLVFANAGVSEILADFIISDNIKRYEYFVASFLLRIIASICGLTICYIIFILSISNDPEFLFAAKLSLLSFIFPPIEIFTQYHAYKGNFRTISIARLFGFLSDFFIKVTILNYKLGLSALVLSRVVEIFVTSFLLSSTNTVFKLDKLTTSKLSWRIFKKTFLYSMPLLAVSLLSFLLVKMDIIMVSQIMNINSVGLYGVSSRIFEFMLMIPTLLVFSVRSKLLKVNVSSYKNFKYEIVKVMSFIFYTSCAIVLLLTAFGRYAIEIVFGSSYSDSYLPMIILSLGCIFISTTLPLTIWQINKGFGKYRLLSQCLSLAINFILNLNLIPLFGIAGAALATSFSFVSTFILSMILFPKQREMLEMLLKCVRYKYLIQYIK